MRMLILLLVLASCGSTPVNTCIEPSGNRAALLGVEYSCSSYGCYELNENHCMQRPNQADRI
jgi:hypothetical protein